jgi:iron(III) transport system substrate-binding protein
MNRTNFDAATERRRFLQGAGALAAAAALPGCIGSSAEEVAVYSSLDREFSDPVLRDFAASTAIATLPKYDVESTKTVGLVNLLIEERARPRCDLFWNNEILHALRLEREGLLATYASPVRDAYPAWASSPDRTWQGFAARARVFLVNKDLARESGFVPASIRDLADERHAGKCSIAKPLFGTTASHAAVLFAMWGEDEAKTFFQGVQRTAKVLSGNRQVAASVAAGETLFGLTDTDDAAVEIAAGAPVEIVYPDQAEGRMGTLLIPNTLCLIKGGPHPENAEKLFDWLLDPQIEARLAEGESQQIPMHRDCTARPALLPTPEPKWAEPDFAAAADAWDDAAAFLRDLFVDAKGSQD